MSTTPKLVREIKPLPVLQARTKNHRLRVAAYCRVCPLPAKIDRKKVKKTE